MHLPMGRFGEAVEIAKGALFRECEPGLQVPLTVFIMLYGLVASGDSSYITGTDFKVDGGLTSCYVTPTGEPLLAPPSSLA